MTEITHETVVRDWIEATNSHDVDRYLSFFTDDAVLNDPSVGGEYRGLARIRHYFESWFIGLNTQTKLISITPMSEALHVEVHFIGDFPEGEADGIFDITFSGEKFVLVTADLA